jgi:hypothetical protein
MNFGPKSSSSPLAILYNVKSNPRSTGVPGDRHKLQSQLSAYGQRRPVHISEEDTHQYRPFSMRSLEADGYGRYVGAPLVGVAAGALGLR